MSAASPYAAALYDVAADAGATDAVERDLRALAEAVSGDPGLVIVLENPAIAMETKRAILHEMGEGASPLVLQTVDVLIDHRRLDILADVANAFSERYRSERNALAVHLTTAVPIDEATAQHLEQQLGAATGSSISMERTVDPSILGGVVLRVRDRVVDASLRRRLDLLGRQMRGSRIPTV